MLRNLITAQPSAQFAKISRSAVKDRMEKFISHDKKRYFLIELAKAVTQTHIHTLAVDNYLHTEYVPRTFTLWVS